MNDPANQHQQPLIGDDFDPNLPYAQWDDDEKEEFTRLCLIAMRLALEVDEAPARCSDRACRRDGRCHVRAQGTQLVCSAGPIPPPVFQQGGLMMAFLTTLGEEAG